MEKPYRGRAHVHDSSDKLTIEIPAKRNWFGILFLPVWLIGWLMGFLAVIAVLVGVIGNEDGTGAPPLFLLFWLVAWTAGGLFALRTLVWMLVGKEVITFDQDVLTVEKKNMLFSGSKVYAISEIENLATDPGNPFNNLPFPMKGMNMGSFGKFGVLKFDYGMKTVKMAGDLDEAEGRHLLKIIRERGYLDR